GGDLRRLRPLKFDGAGAGVRPPLPAAGHGAGIRRLVLLPRRSRARRAAGVPRAAAAPSRPALRGVPRHQRGEGVHLPGRAGGAGGGGMIPAAVPGLDAVFAVVLDRDRARRRHLERELARERIAAEIVPAVDGRDLTAAAL